MPLTPNFTVTQSISNPELITIEDTSSGSDIAVTDRRVYIALSNGTYLVESDNDEIYSEWEYADDTIVLDVIPRSVSPTIRVDWLNSIGTVLYTKSIVYALTMHDDLFSYGLLGGEAENPSQIKDSRYYGDVVRFMADLEHAKNAVLYGADSAAAQSCLNRNHQMQQNENSYF